MKLHVNVIEARSLSPKDAKQCQPLCELFVREDKKQKTKSASTPSWGEEFTFDVPAFGADLFHLTVFDKAGATKNDTIGFLDIQVYHLPPGYVVDSWYPLAPFGKVQAPGEVHLKIQVVPDTVEKWVVAPFAPLNLRVTVHEAKDIASMDTIGKTDPYCAVNMKNSPQQWRTKVLDNCMTPKWEESYDFVLTHPDRDVLVVMMRDKDPGRSQDMALLEIPIVEVKEKPIEGKWYKMTPVKGVKRGGEIKVSVAMGAAPQISYPTVAPGLVGGALAEAPEQPEKPAEAPPAKDQK